MYTNMRLAAASATLVAGCMLIMSDRPVNAFSNAVATPYRTSFDIQPSHSSPNYQQQKRWSSLSMSSAGESTSPCIIPKDNDQAMDSVTSQVLRSASLLNAKGDRVRLGDVMTEGTSVVVFLRHLG